MPGRQPIHPGDRPSPSLAAARAAVHDLPVGWISAGRLHGARSEQCGAVESCQNHLANDPFKSNRFPGLLYHSDGPAGWVPLTGELWRMTEPMWGGHHAADWALCAQATADPVESCVRRCLVCAV